MVPFYCTVSSYLLASSLRAPRKAKPACLLLSPMSSYQSWKLRRKPSTLPDPSKVGAFPILLRVFPPAWSPSLSDALCRLLVPLMPRDCLVLWDGVADSSPLLEGLVGSSESLAGRCWWRRLLAWCCEWLVAECAAGWSGCRSSVTSLHNLAWFMLVS